MRNKDGGLRIMDWGFGKENGWRGVEERWFGNMERWEGKDDVGRGKKECGRRKESIFLKGMLSYISLLAQRKVTKENAPR